MGQFFELWIASLQLQGEFSAMMLARLTETISKLLKNEMATGSFHQGMGNRERTVTLR